MGRKKSILTKCSAPIPFVAYEAQLSDVVCPTIRKVAASGEIHLFDLASIQLELERILANVIERLQCLTAESKGKDVPSLVLTSFQQQQRQATSCDPDANQSLSNGRPALMVKANPDKPLTLIISQRNRLSQLHQPVVHNSEATGSSRAKPFPNLMCGRRISRSSAEEHGEQNLSASPDKNQSASRQVIFVFIQATITWLQLDLWFVRVLIANPVLFAFLCHSYAIPNKFWELMEPYCAEITEANIGYLESLIRSYQELETTYFQLPPLRSPDSQKFDNVESPAPKRPRRDLGNPASHHQQQPSAETINDSEGHMNCSTNTSSYQLARYLESDLRYIWKFSYYSRYFYFPSWLLLRPPLLFANTCMQMFLQRFCRPPIPRRGS
ncbi:hypothetical protein EG68_09285 [Paragonimus skrjabini miyazakii]|uniref:Uncharacterized protein n=1 Tax=Paragonimus skrjabini miyazakii TaxID=59628 RepID=A0A8S9YN77_9TREM|nr:hypothetical protein EG68_09285 [Paragonimus skrjabini miyazakii]